MTDPREMEYTLRKARVGSFSFVDGDEPYVIPWTYGFDFRDGKLKIYVHCAREEGRKREILKKNNKVAIDIHCDLASYTSSENPGTGGWSFRSMAGAGSKARRRFTDCSAFLKSGGPRLSRRQ